MRTHIPNSVLDAQRLATHDHSGSHYPASPSVAQNPLSEWQGNISATSSNEVASKLIRTTHTSFW